MRAGFIFSVLSRDQSNEAAGTARPRYLFGLARLFFQSSRVGDERLNFVVRQFSAKGFHGRLAVFLHAFLDRLSSFGVSESSLNFRIG